MKAFLSKLIITIVILATLAQPTVALAQSQPSPTYKPSQPISLFTPTPTAAVATSAGTIQLIPVGNGQYQIVPQDPRSGNYSVQKAGCGIFGIVCDTVGTVVGNLRDCVTSPFSLDVTGFIYDCSGASTVVDITKKPLEWGFKEIFTIAGSVIKAGVGIIQNTMLKQLAGCEAQDSECWKDQYISYTTPNTPIKNAGTLELVASLTGQAATLQIPVSTDIFIANLNPFRQVSAAGYDDLKSADVVYKIWQNTRNAAYALSIIILVIVGFMIMLRSKLDPKTAVSVTNSLPKIVAMLVLITFSFAISGLIIDFGRIVLQLVLSLIPNVTLNDLSRIFLNAVFTISLPIILLVLGVTVMTGGAGAAGFLLFGGPLVVAGLLIALIFVILLLFLCFYLFYVMVIRYAKFLLTTMFAPLVILILPLPGGTKYLTDFYRRQLAYILTIPIVVTLVEISFLIAGSCIPSPFTGGVFGRPQGFVGWVGASCASSLGAGSFNPLGLTSIFAPFLGLGILMMAAKAPQIADDILGVKPIGGHGGGGHGGPFAILGLPLEGMERAGKSMQGFDRIKKPAGAIFGNVASRLSGAPRSLGTPTSHLTPEAGSWLKQYTGKTAVPTLATLPAGSAVKNQYDVPLRHLANTNQFTGIPAADANAMIDNGDYLPLLNNLSRQIGLPQLNQDGSITGVNSTANTPGRALPRGARGTVSNRLSNLRANYIDQAVIGQTLPVNEHVRDAASAPRFSPPVSETRTPEGEKDNITDY